MRRIAVAVTTSKRETTVLGGCLESLSIAGFEKPIIFAEPDSDLQCVPDGIEIVQRKFKYGAWRNWIFTAREMCDRNPKADAILMVQDDTVFAPGACEVLTRDMWPDRLTGYIQVAVSAGYKSMVKKKGLNEIEVRRVMGAWAVLFPRNTLSDIVEVGIANGWRGVHHGGFEADPSLRKGIDPFIGEACHILGRKGFVYNPSLAEHVARDSNSTLGHDKTGGRPLAIRFGLNHKPGVDLTKIMPAGNHSDLSIDTKIKNDVSVVIPIAGACEGLVTTCIEALAIDQTYLNKIIVVDNGTNRIGELAIELIEQARMSGVLIRNETNLGFSKAINQGIEAAGDDHVLLLNSDCRVGPGSVKLLRESLDKDTASIAPLTFDNGAQSIKHGNRLKQSGLKSKPIRPLDLNAICKKISGKVRDETMLAFFCTLLNSKAIKEIGGLNENLESGLMADNLWCDAAIESGMQLKTHGSAFVDHDHSATFDLLKQDRPKLLREAVNDARKISQSSSK